MFSLTERQDYLFTCLKEIKMKNNEEDLEKSLKKLRAFGNLDIDSKKDIQSRIQQLLDQEECIKVVSSLYCLYLTETGLILHTDKEAQHVDSLYQFIQALLIFLYINGNIMINDKN
jgi:hypothetical protein